MSNNRKVIAVLIAAAALAASGSFVYAQQQKPGDSAVQSRGEGERHAMRGLMAAGTATAIRRARRRPSCRAESRAEDHPGPGKTWQTFADKTRKQAEARAAQRAKFQGRQPAENMRAPERLAQRTARMSGDRRHGSAYRGGHGAVCRVEPGTESHCRQAVRARPRRTVPSRWARASR